MGGQTAIGHGLEALFRLPGVDAPSDVPGQRIRIVRPAALPDTEWILARGSVHLFRVFHEDYEICVLPAEANARHAGATYTYRAWNIPCEPGALYPLEPDTVHTNHRLLGPSAFYVIKVHRATVAALAGELGLGDRPHIRVPASDSPVLMNALAALSSSVAQGERPLEQATLLQTALRALLTELGERAPSSVPRTASVAGLERARAVLHARFTDRITLEDLVSASGLSRFHLVRSFTRRFGVPPHAYLAQLRAAEARRQLAAGLTPSAVDAGFYDQTHLGRHFRRAYAVTPAGYRRGLSVRRNPVLDAATAARRIWEVDGASGQRRARPPTGTRTRPCDEG